MTSALDPTTMTSAPPPDPDSDRPEPEPSSGDGLLDAITPVPYDPALDPVAGIPPESVIEKKPSRAGRDLKAAIGVGVGLGVLVIGTLLLNKVSFLVLVMAAVALGVWEIRGALRQAAVEAPLLPPVLGVVAMLWAAYASGPGALTVAWALTAVAVIVWRAVGRPEGAARDVLGGIFAATYPPFLAGFAALLLAADDGVARLFAFLIITVCSDVGGYAAGVLYGRHPMAPTISPKKSWEGFAGSVLLCVVAGSLTVHFFLDRPWPIGIALGVGVAAVGTVGDLMESLIKRDLGIKDMSNILPGHGGIMDRLDSLILVAPVVWVVLTLLAPAS